MAEAAAASGENTEAEEEPEDSPELVPQSWLAYSWYVVKKIGTTTYGAMHYLGEKLAWGFGITSPDWQYAIDYYEDLQEEERQEREQEERALREQQEEYLQRLRELEGQTSKEES